MLVKILFVPKPKVDSAVIKMVKKDNLEYVKDLDFFRKNS